jgi:putative salt-induced outer membrane protein YdiY
VSRQRNVVVVVGLMAFMSIGLDCAWAQTPAPAPSAVALGKEEKLGWSNSTDLTLVVTSGNSAAKTFGLTDRLKHVWADARFTLDVTGVRSDTSDDRFFLVQPGLQFPVGARPTNPGTTLIKPEPTPDVQTFFVGGRYDKNFNPHFFWNAGASWDHNKDAGILHRYILFAGVGNIWADIPRRRFTTSYGISYTDRKEEEPDPEKDLRFAGVRLGWLYTEHFTANTTFDSDFTSNMNLADAGDYSFNTSNSVSVTMSSNLSLKAGLQFLYENQPALETDLDVVAYAELINPDGVPGTGDEYFRTVESGGTKIVFGTADARKDKLDTIFRTALVISF